MKICGNFCGYSGVNTCIVPLDIPQGAKYDSAIGILLHRLVFMTGQALHPGLKFENEILNRD